MTEPLFWAHDNDDLSLVAVWGFQIRFPSDGGLMRTDMWAHVEHPGAPFEAQMYDDAILGSVEYSARWNFRRVTEIRRCGGIGCVVEGCEFQQYGEAPSLG